MKWNIRNLRSVDSIKATAFKAENILYKITRLMLAIFTALPVLTIINVFFYETLHFTESIWQL